MRLIALVLILANLAFFAWWRYLAPEDEGTEPTRVAQQIAPDTLRLAAPVSQATAAQASCRSRGERGASVGTFAFDLKEGAML